MSIQTRIPNKKKRLKIMQNVKVFTVLNYSSLYVGFYIIVI